MVDPQVIIKANYNRTLLTIRVTAINSPDWVNIVGTRIELFRDSNFSNRFYQNSTTHYKVRAYLENETPDRTIYGKITLTKDDNTTHESTFSFVVPFPILGTVKNENGTKYITSMRKMDKNGNLSPRKYTNNAVINEPPHIDIMADASGGMLVGNQWTTPVTVQNITQNGTRYEVSANNIATVQVAQGDIVRVSESSPDVTFREFANNSTPLCAGVSAHIVAMPTMDKFTADVQGTTVRSYFFRSFNQNGTLTSLPEGSFDTHKITASVYNQNGYIFAYFNQSGALAALPEGSFDTSGIAESRGVSSYTPLGSYSFAYFNGYGALTSLPEGSFDFDNAFFIHNHAFEGFNKNGALTTLPAGAFGFSSITIPSNAYRNWFPEFSAFNSNGRLTTLPDGAFHYKAGLTGQLGYEFNAGGALTSLPEHSFNFLIGGGSFPARGFNKNGALTSLPEGSFQLAPSVTSFGSNAFNDFNYKGALTSLPEHSFNTENITSLAELSFKNFNNQGALVSLPDGSFNFNNVVNASARECFRYFNFLGALKTLPKGSFSFPRLTNVGNHFASEFNQGGALEYLPIGAFSVSTASATDSFVFLDFNAPESGAGGLLTKSDTDYNPEFVYLTSAPSGTIYADYYDENTQTHYQESVAKNNPFKYREADYFSVSYTPSQAYTTDLASEYLSSKTITFSASAVEPGYIVTPTITAGGGADIPVTDNGDGTFTFVMPKDEITVNFAVSI